MSNSITYLGKTYSDNEIISGSFSRRQSLSMSELSVDTMEITVRPYLHLEFFTHEPLPMYTRDKLRFQTSEANPFAEQFQQNTPIVQYADGSQTAIWYLQSIDRMGKNIYKLSGFSSLGRLTQVTHYGGIYDGSQTVADVVQDIVGDIPYYISPEFRNIALYGWLPIASARDNLQQVLFAVNASLQTDEQGILRIQNLSTATQASVAQSDIFQSGASVKYNTPITKVVVVEHQYAQGTGTKQLYSGTATGNQLIAFDEPVSNLTANGLTIVSSGANYAIVSGSGTLTGTTYIHTMREIERDVSTTATVENIVRVDNATLVGITASSDVAHRLAEYYACRNEINVAVAQAFLNCGSVIDTFDPYDEVMRSACIESEQVALSNTKKSTISALVGFSPWQTIPFQDVREVLTGAGMWTAPSNILPSTEVQVVLIGGAQGGSSGYKGESGISEHYSVNWKSLLPESAQGYLPRGGKGGLPGEPGSGGKIYRATVTVNPGQQISFSCGAGGAGGVKTADGSTAGSLGGDTVFGVYSSANGNTSQTGYTDPVTGVVFANLGKTGIAGGDGGGYSGDVETGGDIGRMDAILPVIDEDGNEWHGGSTYMTNEAYSRDEGFAYGDGDHKVLRPSGDLTYGAGGAGSFVSVGSGAAAGANGVSGGQSVGYFQTTRTTTSSGTVVINARSRSLAGIKGADAVIVPHKATGGRGGTGGYGGGGGSGCGWSYVYKEGVQFDGTVNLSNSGAAAGAGGDGSDGGEGSDGQIFLYYRLPLEE